MTFELMPVCKILSHPLRDSYNSIYVYIYLYIYEAFHVISLGLGIGPFQIFLQFFCNIEPHGRIIDNDVSATEC